MCKKSIFKKNSTKNAIAILGPTACGKTHLAVSLAAKIDGEIISADSRQVYRGLDIGSGKDLSEYCISQNGDKIEILHHLIDIVDISSEYNLFNFQEDFYSAFDKICDAGKTAILCGGTGLYADCVIRGYDLQKVPQNPGLREKLREKKDSELAQILHKMKPSLHNSTDLTERERILRAIEIADFESRGGIAKNDKKSRHEFSPVIFCVTIERNRLYERIRLRLKERFDCGMIDEVKNLHDAGASWERLDRLGLEYRWISRYLRGQIDGEKMLFDLLFREICHFAKRQETWFRGMERKGVALHRVGENADADFLLEML